MDQAVAFAHEPAAARSGTAAPVVLRLLAVLTFLPVETSLIVGGLRLPPARLLLLAIAPALCLRAARKVAAGEYRFVASDALVLAASGWMLLGSASVIGVAAALNHAGPEVLEFAVAYFATRLLLDGHGQAVALVNLLGWVIAAVGVLAVLDSALDRFVIHDLASDLTGYAKDVVGRPDYRLGIRRAAGTLEHPILLGASCMVALLCAWAVRPRRWPLVMAGTGLGLVVSVSSAPLQATMLGFGLLTYNRMFRRWRMRWLALVGAAAAVLGGSFLVLGSPLGFVNQYLVFDPESGYARQFEWQVVGEYVAAFPWTGIGFGWDAIAEQIGAFASIDSIWLGKALIYGIPASALIALSYLGCVSLPASGPRAGLAPVESRLGLVLGILMWLLLFLGFTVYFWGSFWILCSFLAGIRAHLGELGRRDGG